MTKTDTPRRISSLLKAHMLFTSSTALIGWTLLTVGIIIAAYATKRPAGSQALVFSLAFACCGVIIIALCFIRGRQQIRLLQEGALADAVLISRDVAGNIHRENRSLRWIYSFGFVLEDGSAYEVKVKPRTRTQRRILKEDPQNFVYDPRRPGNHLLLYAVPGRPVINQFGDVNPQSAPIVFLLLALPVVFLTMGLVLFMYL